MRHLSDEALSTKEKLHSNFMELLAHATIVEPDLGRLLRRMYDTR
jgi:hypothetical protein